MSEASERIFRATAVERLSSPEQLDQLVRITRPFDWLAGAVICLGIVALIVWSVIGRIATRVSGEGILIGDGGRMVDVVSSAAGHLDSIEVAAGDPVTRGQFIARIVQMDAEQSHREALDALRDREREHAELMSIIDHGVADQIASLAAQRAALDQAIAAAERRIAGPGQDAGAGGLIEDRRREVADARQRIGDARQEILRLNARQVDLEAQRNRDRADSELRLNEVRRQVQHLAAVLKRDSRVTSPIDGRVIEIKASVGAALSAGTSILDIEAEAVSLMAVIYIPVDRGKNVERGMAVRVEPATVRREEFGAVFGKVVSRSEFPVTPQGIAAALHNEILVTRFSREASYAVVVGLERDERAASGYRWSSTSGPAARLTAGTLARAEITISEQPPIDLLLPLIRRVSGIGG